MSTSRSTTTKALVSAIAYMDTREINKGIMSVNNETGFHDLMRICNRTKKTSQPSYHHFVDEDLFQVVVFDTGGVSGSGTATLTVTITGTGFVRRGNKLLFSNGKVGMINSAITTASSKDSFTIKSVDGSNLTAVAGDKVSVIGLVVGEGSSQVQALHYSQTKYFNLVEAMRDKTKITNIQAKSEVEAGGKYAYTQAIAQAQSFKSQISATLIGGVKSVNEFGTASPSLVDENGNSVQTTGGLDQETTTYGVSDSVATPGAVVLSDADDLCDQLVAIKANSNYMKLCTDKGKRLWSKMWKNMDGAITAGRLDLDGKTLDFNVETAIHGRFKFDYVPLQLLDHPQIFNFSGGPTIGKNLYAIPKDKVKTTTGEVEPRLGIRYIPNSAMSKGRGTEMIKEWYTGADAPVATDDESALTVHFETIQGLEAIGTKHFVKQRVVA